MKLTSDWRTDQISILYLNFFPVGDTRDAPERLRCIGRLGEKGENNSAIYATL